MAIYRYPTESLIDEVHVLTNEKGGLRAYLYADNGSDTEHLRRIKQDLRAEGMKCVPTVHEGRPVLEVRGFKKTEELITNLDKLHAFKGNAHITAEASDVRSKKEQRANSTLKLAGLSYNVGDISYIIYAYRQFKDEFVPNVKGNLTNFFNKFNIYAGIGYALGSTALSVYGSRDQSLNTINAANQKIYAHLRKEGIDVPEGSTLKSATQEKDRGFFGNIDHFLAKYPSETLNSIYVFVGFALMTAAGYRATRPTAGLTGEALAHAIKDKKAEVKDIGLGVMTAGSALAGLMIKEKKPIEGERKRKGIGRVIDWIQEKPLRATGIGYFISTLFHAASTVDKYRIGDVQTRKTVVYRGVFVAANIFSEVMLFLSSKGHGTGVKPDDSVDRSVIAATAELTLRQPLEKREKFIENISGFMASRDVLGLSAEKISAELRTHIKALESSPWTKYYVAAKADGVADVATLPGDNPLKTEPKEPAKAVPTTMISHAQHNAKHQQLELSRT